MQYKEEGSLQPTITSRIRYFQNYGEGKKTYQPKQTDKKVYYGFQEKN